MAKRGVIISTNMKSTTGAERIYDAVHIEDVENAMIGHLDELAIGEDCIYNFAVGAVAKKEIVIVDQPAWDYDESKRSNQRKDKFYIEAGTAFRVRKLAIADEFGFNTAAVTLSSRNNLDVGAYITADATTGKLVASATSNSSAAFEAVIIRKYMQGARLVTSVRSYGTENEIYEVKVTKLA